MPHPPQREPELRIGVSACLMGEPVRFDGGHKRAPFVTDVLGEHASFERVCPELELGLGAPRESLRLVRETGAPEARLVAAKSGADHTEAMRALARRRAEELAGRDLCGFVLKKDSPSCGLFRVRVYGRHGSPAKDGRGLFAEELVRRMPHLPVEEEGRLSDPVLRENFIVRVFAYRRLKDLFAGEWGVGDLVRFHTREKLLLFAHDEARYRELGRVVAGAKGRERGALAREYGDGFMTALESHATPRRNVNVLQHAMGHFKQVVDPAARAETHGVIEDYRAGWVPLAVPIALVRHHARRADVGYLLGQTYFDPTPKELALRNHVPARRPRGERARATGEEDAE